MTDVKALQPEKALFLIVVILSGMTMDVKLLQFSNASSDSKVRLSERIMDVKPEHP